jgi:hypothetical protein
MYEIKIIPAEHVCNADIISFNTMQRNLKYKSIIIVEKHLKGKDSEVPQKMQLNFAAVLKYSLVTYVNIIRDRCQKQKTEL